jgi:hypothetical protein
MRRWIVARISTVHASVAQRSADWSTPVMFGSMTSLRTWMSWMAFMVWAPKQYDYCAKRGTHEAAELISDQLRGHAKR